MPGMQRDLRWARLGSNQRPPACEAGALPLSYAPRPGHLSLRPDGDFLETLQLALVDVALLGGEQLAAGELGLVDRVVELPRREAVADPVDVRHLALQLEVELFVCRRAGRQDDGVDRVDRLR